MPNIAVPSPSDVIKRLLAIIKFRVSEGTATKFKSEYLQGRYFKIILKISHPASR